jgi:hypothetical protein
MSKHEKSRRKLSGSARQGRSSLSEQRRSILAKRERQRGRRENQTKTQGREEEQRHGRLTDHRTVEEKHAEKRRKGLQLPDLDVARRGGLYTQVQGETGQVLRTEVS